MITATLATACQKMHLYIFLNLVFYQLIIYTFQGHYEYSHSEITCKLKTNPFRIIAGPKCPSLI